MLFKLAGKEREMRSARQRAMLPIVRHCNGMKCCRRQGSPR